ncbi:MAG: hypothetical protein H7Y07_08025 [Pyrinomonadaceae bacterium]|nr:hypothetical protein [Sphingobacteriaceae bacterium]
MEIHSLVTEEDAKRTDLHINVLESCANSILKLMEGFNQEEAEHTIRKAKKMLRQRLIVSPQSVQDSGKQQSNDHVLLTIDGNGFIVPYQGD